MKYLIKFLFIAIISSNFTYAQKIKLKKGKILVDDIEVFNYDSSNSEGWLSIYDIESGDEVIFIKEADNGTYTYQDDDYTIYKFLEQEVIVEISGYSVWKSYIKFLFKNKVFDTDGKLNDSKIAALKTKFDENITERTIKN